MTQSGHDRLMELGEPLLPRQLVCARCGAAFDCSLGGDCWCHAASFRLPMPEAGSGQDCLCPACLQAADGRT
jgi:hypothetical protein